MQRLVIGTRSTHKLAELRSLLELEHTQILSLDELGIAAEVPEEGATFEANARAKAVAFAALSRLPTLADDSGLEVDALDGAPGVRTRRYAGETATDEENNAKLLATLEGLPREARTARYRCVLAFCDPARSGGATPEELTAAGTLEGRIALARRGSGGFGYDPIFEPLSEPPGGRTVAMMSAEEKNEISHRGRAAREMRRLLAQRGY